MRHEDIKTLRDFIDHTPFRGPTTKAVRAHEALTRLVEQLEALREAVREHLDSPGALAGVPLAPPSVDSKRHSIERLLAIVSDPETPEQRDEAWREIVEQLEAVQRERDLIGTALGEPCAECGHIEWRSDGYPDMIRSRLVAADEAVETLRAALQEITDFGDRTAVMIANRALASNPASEPKEEA